jgi:hypothetical protein
MSAFVDRFDLGDRDGPTIAIKDCIDIEGMPTRAGQHPAGPARCRRRRRTGPRRLAHRRQDDDA